LLADVGYHCTVLGHQHSGSTELERCSEIAVDIGNGPPESCQ
jgi:hypothetical protein